MTKRQTESGDWSSASKALFHSAREGHAPTLADRARVRSALAQRLAEGSTGSALGGDEQVAILGKSATRVAVENLVKIGLGLACVMAGVFAFIRMDGSKKQIAPQPPSVQTTTAGDKVAERVSEPSVIAPQEPGLRPNDASEPERVSQSASAPSSRVVSKRARAHSTSTKVGVSGRGAGRSQPKLTAAAAPAVDSQPSAIGSAAASANAVAVDSADEAVLAPRAEASTATSQTRARVPNDSATAEDSADVRAELAFVEKINAAMLASKLRTVLALCAEHARRWPHGTFVQEREGLRAIASCGTGVLAASARARTFLASYPRAPLAPRVRDACATQLTAAVQAHSVVGVQPSGKANKD